MSELKPCPFCGSENVEYDNYDDMPIQFIGCECGAEMRGGYDDDVYELWNTRSEIKDTLKPLFEKKEIDNG